MKKFHLYLWSLILFSTALISCSEAKENEPEVEKPLIEALNAVYTNRVFPENELVLSSCGNSLLDRDAKFSTYDLKNGTVTLFNVLPGESVTSFAVSLLETEQKEVYSLQVWQSSILTDTGIRINFGPMTLRRGKLEIDLQEITYPVNRLSASGWWTISQSPLHLYWKVIPGIYQVGGGQIEITEAGSVNPGYISMLSSILETSVIPNVISHVYFGRNGVMRARYSGMKEDSSWNISPDKNLIQYYLSSANLYLIPNITEIVAQITSDQTRADEGGILPDGITEEMIEKLLVLVSGWLQNGIPMGIRDNEDGSILLYLDHDQLGFILELLPVLIPLFADTIMELIPEDMAGELGELISGLLTTIGVYGANTEVFELGLNFISSQEPETFN